MLRKFRHKDLGAFFKSGTLKGINPAHAHRLAQLLLDAATSLMEMHNPPHPGQLINDIYLTPYSITVADLAGKLGVAVECIGNVVSHISGIDAPLAIRLEAVLGGSAQAWLGMQSSYDIWHARQQADLSGLEKMSFPDLGEVPHADKYYA